MRRTVSTSWSGPGTRIDAVGLKALLRANRELALRLSLLVDELSAQAVARQAALPEAEANEPALAREDLHGELAAVLAGHRPLHALDDRRAQAAIVLELLRAVVNDDAGLLAEELVVGAFVGVLESTPATHVVDEDGREVGTAGPHVVDQLLQRVAAVEAQTALPVIGVGTHDLDASLLGVALNDLRLILSRVLLVLSGHPDVLRGSDRRGSAVPSCSSLACQPCLRSSSCASLDAASALSARERQGYAKEMRDVAYQQ